jgi:hypothetical protein
MPTLTLFIKDSEGVFNAVATVEAHGLTLGRAVWNTDTPDQHGTDALWSLDDKRHIIVSPLETLRIDSAHYSLAAISIAQGLVYLVPVEPREMPSERPLFELGRVVATPGALTVLDDAAQAPSAFLTRHQCGDWGDVCADDKRENDRALKAGNLRILSSYQTTRGAKLWCITEADRSATTLLLPSEY